MEFKLHGFARNKHSAKRVARRLKQEGWLTGSSPHSGGGFKLFIKPAPKTEK